MRVCRVYWWTDWIAGVRYATAELWRAAFGCQHHWETIRFKHVHTERESEYATVSVNYCSKCRTHRSFGRWWKPTRENGW